MKLSKMTAMNSITARAKDFLKHNRANTCQMEYTEAVKNQVWVLMFSVDES